MSHVFRCGPPALTYVRNAKSTSQSEQGSGILDVTTWEGLMRHRLPLERLPHCYATLRQKARPAAPTEPAPLCGEYRESMTRSHLKGSQTHVPGKDVLSGGSSQNKTRNGTNLLLLPMLSTPRQCLNCLANLGFAFVCSGVAPCLLRSWLWRLSAATPYHPW